MKHRNIKLAVAALALTVGLALLGGQAGIALALIILGLIGLVAVIRNYGV